MEPLLKAHLTEACSFPVYVQTDGYLNVTLQYNREGRLVRETYSIRVLSSPISRRQRGGPTASPGFRGRSSSIPVALGSAAP